MELFVATNNQHKISEISAILERHGIKYRIPKKDELPEVEETGKDLTENAILKAKAGYRFSGLPTMADDTGLEVGYLDGAPGVYSARFAGKHCSYADNNKKLLKLLEDVEFEKRKARFRTVIALVLGDGRNLTVEGSVEGYIIDEPRGSNGFGYDPVFYYPPLDKTLAELSSEEKNRISHRANALVELDQLLKKGVL
ncbi:MAG: XTP/dITP diphosphatase [candidate division Zixibacteria bacterium]|nr:XTP/dITP diphosphatase [candidate division Zixibacteria bacterium]